jgi:arsenite methyltransferase
LNNRIEFNKLDNIKNNIFFIKLQDKKMELVEIQKRYGNLAEDSCCLSCGGAINYSQPKTGEVCIDLGSGRGTDAIRLAEEVGKDGFVYGIDVTPEMISKAKKTAEKLRITNIEFKQSILEKIELKDGLADLIISNCTINHVADKPKVWSEIFRLLKDGGRFVISDIYSLEVVPEKYHNDPVAVSECWGGAITKEEYLDIIDKTGFSNIKILEESEPYKKGEIKVASFTLFGKKQIQKCCCKK